MGYVHPQAQALYVSSPVHLLPAVTVVSPSLARVMLRQQDPGGDPCLSLI